MKNQKIKDNSPSPKNKTSKKKQKKNIKSVKPKTSNSNWFLMCDASTTVGSLRGLSPYLLDWDILVGKFELQSRYYVQIRKNTLRKSIAPLILTSMS